MAKISIPSVRTNVFGAKTGLTAPGLAQSAAREQRNIDYKSKAPFMSEVPSSNVSPRKVKL